MQLLYSSIILISHLETPKYTDDFKYWSHDVIDLS